MQDGEEVVYDMDIEILDSYPTIEILGILFFFVYFTAACK
jgi:hypothetical protein